MIFFFFLVIIRLYYQMKVTSVGPKYSVHLFTVVVLGLYVELTCEIPNSGWGMEHSTHAS